MAQEQINYPQSFNDNYSEQNIADTKKIIDWLNDNKKRTMTHLAKAAGSTPGAVSQIVNGKYAAAPSTIIDVFLAVVNDNLVVSKPGDVVHTSIYLLSQRACDIARETQRFAVLTGAPGVGKSTALTDYANKNPHAIYMRGSEWTTANVLLDELMEALNIRNAESKNKAYKAKQIINKLRGSNRLLILDEADKCSKDTCDPLRTISEESGCGVVLAGNVQLYQDIKSGKYRYDLISDRVTFWPMSFTAITEKDAADLLAPYLKHEKLAEPFEVICKYVHELSKGSARQIIKGYITHIQRLKKTEAFKNKAISCEHFAFIGKQLLGVINPPPLPQINQSVVIPN